MRQLSHPEINNFKHYKSLIIVCDGISDKRNIGMISRLAEAFGISKIILNCNQITFDQKIRKISRSTVNAFEWSFTKDLSQELVNLKELGYVITSVEYCDKSKDLNQLSFEGYDKMVLIIGHESKGVSQTLLDLSDLILHIPMYGKNTSINVTHALAIALNQITTN